MDAARQHNLPETRGRAEQRRRTRQRLARAATELSQSGQTVTIEDTATRAGVSRATAYRYFPSVELLRLEAAMIDAFGSVDGPVAEVNELCARIADHADRLEAVVRRMAIWAWDVQASLRITMRHALDGNYVRPAYREPWIAAALAPALPELNPRCAEQLHRALYPLFGLEPLLSLTDLLHLDREQTLDTLAFTARALITTALRESKSPNGRSS